MVFGLSKVECPRCHEKNESGRNFCSSCGERLPNSKVRCSSCGANVDGGHAFCTECGKPLAESSAPQVTGNRWARRTGDFATKVTIADVDGFFKKGLIVEAGTKALFFSNGAYAGIVDAGKHEMGGLLHRIKNVFNSKATTALLVDAGDVELKFEIDGLLTKDPLSLTASVTTVLHIDNPAMFYENLMKARQNYSLGELQAYLTDELTNGMREVLGAHSVHELSTSAAVKQELERAASRHLATTLERKGLLLIQVRVFDFRHERLDRITQKREEYWLDAETMRAKAAGDAGMVDAERRILDQETARWLSKVEVAEERNKVFERATAAERDTLTTEEGLRRFRREVDKRDLVSNEEWENLAIEYHERGENHDLARKHYLAALDIAQKGELSKLQLLEGLSEKRLLSDAGRSEKMTELEHQLSLRRRSEEERRKQEYLDWKQGLDAKGAEWKQDFDAEGAEVDRALGWLGTVKDRKHKDEDLELDRRLRERSGTSEIDLREGQKQHEWQMEQMRTMSSLSSEALIALAPADRASMLAELKRTETLKGMSEEQILALAAQHSPHVAQAFQEKYKQAGASQVSDLYQKLLESKDKGSTDLLALSRENAKIMQEMFNKGMDTQRDTASAAARSAQPGMTVIAPGAGGSGVVHRSGGGTPRIVACGKCHVDLEEGTKFCGNCGHQQF